MPFLAMQGRPFFVHWSHTGQGVPRPSDADLTVEVWVHEELAALPNLPQRICTCQTQSRCKSVHCSHEPLQGRVFTLFGGVSPVKAVSQRHTCSSGFETGPLLNQMKQENSSESSEVR